MKQTRTKIAKTIADRIDRSDSPQAVSREIAAYLLAERRVDDLDSVMRDLWQIRADAGVVEVVAASAHPLTDDIKQNIKSEIKRHYPDAKDISIDELFDPTIIGGVRLSLANQQLDMSVEAKLNKFKQLTAVGKE